MKKLFCPTCGKEVLITDRYCPFCGVELKLTYWNRQTILKTLRETPPAEPKYKKIIKRLKEVIKQKNDKKDDS